ncbi:HAD family hydrolase [Lignipirellula cremea]|uniref:Beta-phosphoglucomutase n=1 Tax=Lignipirellula cremea TaxID=2528010 RepID=A0A518DUV3_9BACT|nr:HAD family phosphatase [Lignipirellula cremea]QDU95613.1 Beta-phosphoglucomutase [Lignipirellula cremea]
MPSLQAVIFDVDGVLIDSYHAHFESWRIVAAEHGMVMTPEDFHATFGRTSRETVRAAWPERSFSDEQVRQLDEEKEAVYRKLLAENFPAMPGAVALIADLAATGVGLAVGSSGPPPNVRLTLDLLGCKEQFQVVVTGADVTRGKPDPEVFLTAAQRLGLSPADCLVIEDAAAGIKAAQSAGMKAVGLVSTGHTRQELAAADLLVDQLADLTVARLQQLAV